MIRTFFIFKISNLFEMGTSLKTIIFVIHTRVPSLRDRSYLDFCLLFPCRGSKRIKWKQMMMKKKNVRKFMRKITIFVYDKIINSL